MISVSASLLVVSVSKIIAFNATSLGYKTHRISRSEPAREHRVYHSPNVIFPFFDVIKIL